MNLIKKIFEVDLRSLALFRITFGFFLLCDLISRSIWMKAHYTDFGIAPRSLLLEGMLHSDRFSFHLFSGKVEFQFLIFAVAFLFTLFYTLGYKTRVSGLIAWILLLSLQNRNNMILSASDVITRMMFFWSLFLPLSNIFSIDSALKKVHNKLESYQYFSLANIFFLLQLCFMYWFSIGYKITPYWLDTHLAVYYSLNIDQYVKPLGVWARQFVGMTKFFTVYTLFIEIMGPLMALVPFRWGWIRFIGAAAMINLHQGLFVTLEIGYFPWVCMASWLAFFPSCVWDLLSKLFSKRLNSTISVFADGDCSFCLKLVSMIKTFLILPGLTINIAQEHNEEEKMREQNSWIVLTNDGERLFHFSAFLKLLSLSPYLFWLSPILRLAPFKLIGDTVYKIVASNRSRFSISTRWLVAPKDFSKPGILLNLFLVFCFSFVVLHNFAVYKNSGFSLPSQVKSFGRALSLMQRWNMFASPGKKDGWFLIKGELVDEQKVNVWTEEFGETSEERPELISAQYVDVRWRKYLMGMLKGDKERLLYFGKYLCRRWNNKYETSERLKTFKIYFFEEKTRTPGIEFTIKRKRLWTHRCEIKS